MLADFNGALPAQNVHHTLFFNLQNPTQSLPFKESQGDTQGGKHTPTPDLNFSLLLHVSNFLDLLNREYGRRTLEPWSNSHSKKMFTHYNNTLVNALVRLSAHFYFHTDTQLTHKHSWKGWKFRGKDVRTVCVLTLTIHLHIFRFQQHSTIPNNGDKMIFFKHKSYIVT